MTDASNFFKTLRECSKLWYYKIQFAKGNRSTCEWNYETPIVLCETQTKFLPFTEIKL